MFSYVTKELPEIVEKYFHICSERRSITGMSMGGHGALLMAAKLPHRYRSVTSMSPVSRPLSCERFARRSYEAFFGSFEAGADFSLYDVLYAKGASL